MVKKTFTRKEIVRKGIFRIRLCCVRYKAGDTDMKIKAFDIAGNLYCLEIIPYDKYDLLMDIIRREFVD